MNEWTVADLEQTTWFGHLQELVQHELDRLTADQHDRRPELMKAVEDLRKQIQGWSLSLANVALNQAARSVLESELGNAVRRRQELERILQEADVIQSQRRQLIDPEQVIERLNRLASVLAANNPTRTNLELSLHIDAIRCYQDGRVVVKTCKLGALAGTTEIIARVEAIPTNEATTPESTIRSTARRRPARRVDDGDGVSSDRNALMNNATDVDRFAGLGSEWFWEDEFRIPDPVYWSKERASEVRSFRAQGWTHERLANHFGVSLPTIRKALRIAATSEASLPVLPRKMPRGRWAEQHADEVAHKRKEGMKMTQLALHFGKSTPIIRRAIRYAAARSAAEPADADGESLPSEVNSGEA